MAQPEGARVPAHPLADGGAFRQPIRIRILRMDQILIQHVRLRHIGLSVTEHFPVAGRKVSRFADAIAVKKAQQTAGHQVPKPLFAGGEALLGLDQALFGLGEAPLGGRQSPLRFGQRLFRPGPAGLGRRLSQAIKFWRMFRGEYLRLGGRKLAFAGEQIRLGCFGSGGRDRRSFLWHIAGSRCGVGLRGGRGGTAGQALLSVFEPALQALADGDFPVQFRC